MLCKNCNKEFFPSKKKQLYCSRVCRDRYIARKYKTSKKNICLNCNKEFTTQIFNPYQKYCKKECRLIKHNQRRRTRKQEARSLRTYSKEICLNCKNLFEKKRYNQIYCNIKCEQNFNYKKSCEHKGRKSLNIIKICPTCSTGFEPKVINQVFCKKECRTPRKNICLLCKKLKFIYGHGKCRNCWRKEWRAMKNPVKNIFCQNCGKEKKVKHSLYKFCSNNCKIYFHHRTERSKEYNRNWHKKNPETSKRIQKKFSKSIKGILLKLKTHENRRLLKKDSKFKLTDFELKRIVERDLCCVYCKKELSEYSVDHIISLSKGGSGQYNNFVLSCRSCNSSKGNKNVFEWCKSKNVPVPKIVINLLNEQKNQKKIV